MEKENKSGVIWAPQSLRDLLDVRDHLAITNSQSIAESSVLRIHEAADKLPTHPQLWRERNEIALNVRLAPVHPYFICYRILPSHVEVVRIVHEKRDIIAMFASSERRV